MYLNTSAPTIRNTILWGNTSPTGAGIDGTGATITYSLVQGMSADPTNHNLDGATDPLFVNAASGDLHLQSISPAINVGNNSVSNPVLPVTDVEGHKRIWSSTVDLGAYENHIILYVNMGAGGVNDGSGWENAFTDLQSALAVAQDGNEIWVAKGTYKPTSGIDRTISFNLISGLGLYGGFAGTETARADRNWLTNKTILSGDIDTSGANDSYHVVYGTSLSASTVLDGFTISSGRANGFGLDADGGGIYLSSSAATLSNLIISNNNAANAGGGLRLTNSSAALINMVLTNNSATVGGGIYLSDSSPNLTNVTLAGNSATGSGGGIYLAASVPTIRNTILWGNTATTIGTEGIDGTGATITYSLIQGMSADPTNHNLDGATDPRFVNAASGDLHLQSTSPAINMGNNSVSNPALPLTDVDGRKRIWSSTADLGAYENHTISYVKKGAAGIGDGSSWTDAFSELSNALADFRPGDGEIWVAAGTYKPTNGIDRAISFNLISSLGIYGGFAGTETARADRDWTTNKTILSGDIDTSGANDSYHVVYGSSLSASTVLDGFTISGGKADGSLLSAYGSGVYLSGSAAILSNLTLSGNSASQLGGGMFLSSYCNSTLTNITFSGNSAAMGAGVYIESSAATLTDVSFTNNIATTYGGGMDLRSSQATMTNVILTNNSATSDGGGMILNNSQATLTNVTLTSNSAGYGGGIYLGYSSNPTLTNVTFTSNSATNFGGGMYVINTSSPTLINVTLTNNSAGYGGGIYLTNSSSPTLTNVTFTSNSATNFGGGMYLTNNSSPILTNVTIAKNSAPNGGGMQVISSSPMIRNTIVWGNTGSSDEINGLGAVISYSLIGGKNNTSNGNLDGTNPANDPLFINAASGNLRLKSTSPAINKGYNNITNPTLPLIDLDGNLRTVDTTVDLGAYENQAPNHAPVFSGVGNLALDEDPANNPGATVASLLDTYVTDSDGTASTAGIAIFAADTANGKWQRSSNGKIWADLGVVSANSAELYGSGGYLRFVPNADWNGTSTLSVRAWDGADGRSSGETGVNLSVNGGSSAFSTATQTLTATVTAVNDVPSFTKGGDVTVDEDAPAYSAAWATDLSKGPANESAQTLSFNVINNNNDLFSVQPTISASGTLSFTPAANANGSATITVSLSDSAGATSGDQTFTITVNSVNDMPSFTKGADVTVDEDAPAYSAAWATALWAGPANESAQILSFNANTNNTALFLIQPAIAANGTLTFTPAVNANGTATVSVSIQDNGGTANDGVAKSADQTFIITINPVNDAPSFTTGGDVTVDEDTTTYSAVWATGLSAGPADESDQTLSFNVSNNNTNLFSSQPTLDSNGKLTFTPAAHTIGSATITISLSDSAGATSVDQTFTITVNPVMRKVFLPILHR